MANEFIVRKGYIALENSQVTGSLSVTGNISASIFSGSFVGNGSQLTGVSAGFPFTGSAQITGSLGVTGSVTATSFFGNGSQLTGIDGFPFTGSAAISGSLIVVGPVNATSFTGSIQGTATTASYVQLANVDGFTAYSASINTAIIPQTATVNTGSSPLTLTTQSIVIADSTNGNLIVNLPDLNTVVGTPNQKPIVVYKNDYSQNVIYVNPSGSQLLNGASQDIIVSIQLAVIYNPTSAGWVTEGTSAQSLAELELFFLSLTETGSLATTGSNVFIGNQIVTGSLTVTGNITGNITGSASTASYVEYTNVANKPALVSGSAQITYSGLTGIPSGIVSGSAQVASFGIFATTGSNGFNGSQSITGSLTVTGQVVAQTLNVQQVTSSIVYSSGSNIFGNTLGNTQQFTGSVSITGSLNTSIAAFGSAASTFLTSDGGVIKSRTAAQTLSDIAALPLAGGTLTGALNGTSATFSSNVDITGTGNVLIVRKASNIPNIAFAGASSTFSTIDGDGATLNFRGSNSNIGLSVANTLVTMGVALNGTSAVFSSSVQGDFLVVGTTAATSGGLRLGTQVAIRARNVANTANIPLIESTASDGVSVSNGALTLASTGAATFSSRLEADGIIRSISATAAASGSGAEIAYSGGVGYFLAYNRSTSAYLPVGINGSTVTISSGASATVAMTITSTGNVLIGKTDATIDTGDGLRVDSDGTVFACIINGESSYYIRDITNAAYRFRVSGAGTVFATNTTISSISDLRLKENVRDLDTGLDKIMLLKPRVFDWKEGSGQTGKDVRGFIAQEVEEYFPELIDEWSTEDLEEGEVPYKSVRMDVIPMLVKAIQEQQSQIEILKAEIQTLKQ